MNRVVFRYHGSSHDFKNVDNYLKSFPIKRQVDEHGRCQIWLYTGPTIDPMFDPMLIDYLAQIILKTIQFCKAESCNEKV